jgi:hypothetical protein
MLEIGRIRKGYTGLYRGQAAWSSYSGRTAQLAAADRRNSQRRRRTKEPVIGSGASPICGWIDGRGKWRDGAGNGEGGGGCELQGRRRRRGRLWRSGGSCDEPLRLSLDAGEECDTFSFFSSLAADGVAYPVNVPN